MAHKLKPTLAFIILVSILSFYLPLSANAQDAGIEIINGIKCTVSGALGNFFINQMSEGIRKFANSQILAGALDFLGDFLYKSTVPINDKANDTRITIMDVAARCFARELMNDLTARITGAVRTGGRDSRPGTGTLQPSFVRDWRRFLTNAEHRGENIFRSMLGSADLCPYITGDMRTIFQANNQPPIDRTITRSNNLDPFQTRAKCTMPRGWNAQSFQSNFTANGGWGALARMSEPQNNFYGTFLLSMSEVAVQRGLEKLSDNSESTAGNGLTSRRGKPGDTCAVRGARDCLIYKDILTPGSVIGNAFNATVAQEMAWLVNVDQWNEIIQHVMTSLMSRILNLSEPGSYSQELFPPEDNPSPYDRDFNDDSFGSLPPGVETCFDNALNQNETDVDFGGVCGGGGTPPPGPRCVPLDGNFATQVETAFNNVSNNTTLDEGSKTRDIDADAFLDALVIELRNMGLRAGRLNNGRVRGDTIIVGNSSDPLGHIYDIIGSSCSPGNIGNSVQNICIGQTEPWSSLRDPGAVSQTCGVYESPPIPQPVTQCSDGADNDCDGLNNMADPECRYPSDNDEADGGGPPGPTNTVTFCVDPSFGGACDTFNLDFPLNIADFDPNPIMDNRTISSLRIIGTSMVTVCSGTGFTGTCQDFSAGDFPDLGGTAIGDNAISSARSSGPSSTVPPTPLTECNDGQDNDFDGAIDYSGGPSNGVADSDCNGDPNGTTEGVPIP